MTKSKSQDRDRPGEDPGPAALPQGSLGAWLRAQREARGVGLREIADASKISLRYLEALETDRFEVLPAPVFTRGFLREYARVVGLDPDEVVNLYLVVARDREPEVAAPSGVPEAVAARPRTDYVARLVGLNLYRGRADGRTVEIADGFTLSSADSVRGEAFVAFPPSAVALHPHRPEGSPRNTWPAVLADIQRHGDNLRVRLEGPIAVAAEITPAAAAQLRLSPGMEMWVAVKASETRAYPAD